MAKTPERKLEATRRYRNSRRKDLEWVEHQKKYMAEYRAKNKERLAEKDRLYQRRNALRIQLRRKGLDPSLEGVIKAHKGQCDICGGPPDGKWGKLNIDHCHQTGVYRGMLCFKCNKALGYFQDDARILRRAISYLKKVRP